MYRTNIKTLVISAVLIIVAVVGVQANEPAGSPTENGHTYAGTGDALRLQVRPSNLNRIMQEDGHTYAGTGDAPRFRVKPSK